MAISANAKQLLTERYCLPGEQPKDVYKRVAEALALGDIKFEKQLHIALYGGYFLPNTPCLMNAGVKKGQLHACFCLPVGDDISSIFDTLKNMAVIFKSGGGVGANFSTLRPKGDPLSNGGTTSGVVSFMGIYDSVTEAVKQGGKRRGALMGILDYNHPEIENFITAKCAGRLTNFNISVMVDDKFMQAVRDDKEVPLKFGEKQYGSPVKARHLFTLICSSAWQTGDPGILFKDRINRDNKLYPETIINTTNPCSEVALPHYGACCLGSINIAKFVKKGKFDFKTFQKYVEMATRALINMNVISYYPLPQITKIMKELNPIGVGIMGFADALIKLGIYYDSEECLEFIRELGEYYKTGTETKITQGCFYKRIIAPTGSLSLLADCLSEDTLVDTLKGKIPIKELEGTNPYIYSYDIKNRKVIINQAKKIWKKGKQKVYRIIFDTGDFIELTSDHRVLMLNSKYKLAKELQLGDRVKALYKWISNGRYQIRASDIASKKQSWVSYESFKGKIKKGGKGKYPELIHHIDNNPLNDEPNNLEKMTNKEHNQLHKPYLTPIPEAIKKRAQEKLKNNYENEEFRNAHSKATKKGMWSKKGRHNYLNAMKTRRSYKGENNPAYNRDIDIWLAQVTKNPRYCKCGCGQKVIIKRYHHYAGIPKFIQGHRHNMIKNHKIVSIEYIGEKEVYDLDTGNLIISNFSANGVFVHNCSSGVEPVFERHFQRHLTVGVMEEVRQIYQSKYCRTAMEISPEWHLKVQATWQEQLDGGLSKTINLPANANIQDIWNIYYDAWELGAKGVTVFREGCKEGVLRKISKCSDGECHL